MPEKASPSERERILNRLKKILALTKSSTHGEAAAALHHAQKLMAAHQLTEDDVAMHSIRESRVPLSSCDLPKWESALVAVVVAALGVEAMIERLKPMRGLSRREKAKVIFVSNKGREEIAAYAFQTLRRQLTRDLQAALREIVTAAKTNTEDLATKKRIPVPPAWRESYALAWCATLRKKVSGLVDEQTPARIAAYIENQSKGREAQAKLAPRNESLNKASDLFANMGFRDGQKVQIHRAMNSDIAEQLNLPQ